MDYSKFGNMMEKNRVESFKKWPFDDSSACSIKKMAEAGFYWSGNEREPDTVTCYVCNKTLDGWEPTDDPWKEHAKHAPQCNFVKYGRKEAELTVDEFIKLFSVAVKGRMEQNLNKVMDQFRKWAENEKEKLGK
ncbi:PREDICTED: baculoviral IAP repeat-containing protein 5 [Rhagoletis zephyria]|uniref:baculoviral IAP repeat-containing protein 5 n=1 Tax=Rhagoletis zephyria TaxID=28612 RepID=UPI00081165D3|nr:PREDICTED: baculoviral IAP repeat-containing protein 5 [Rhagoletis zephyria]